MLIKSAQKTIWKVRYLVDSFLPEFIKTGYQLMNLSYLEIFTSFKNKKILVVGMGKGAEIPAMFDRGFVKVVGIDPCPEPTFPVEKYGKQLKIIKGKAEKLPLKDNSFDVVYSVATLEHVENPQKVVKEMLRVLKTGGIFYCAAGPLWNSFDGFHPNKEFPLLNIDWFHLDHTMKSMAKKVNKKTYLKKLERIYESDVYNRLPASSYYSIASLLIKNCTPLEIDFYLTSNRLKRLKKKNIYRYRKLTKMYLERELTTDCFRWIFIK